MPIRAQCRFRDRAGCLQWLHLQNLLESTMQGPFESETLYLAHELARVRAARLREEAIDDFWRGADTVLRRGLDRSQRAAQRLLHRLRRHAAGRAMQA
jgi:hypothetical protein